uniref:Uncharacterized protein n=1 Tax=Knipowitschia caucasica TaxID=637954 RepID=A0AAV2JNA1_KNICA
MEGLQQSLIDKDKIITTNQSLMSDFEIDRKALQDRITSLTAEMVLKDQSSVGEITEITKDYTLKVSSLQEQMEGLQQSLIDKDKIITTNQSLMSDFEIDRKALQDRITSLTEEMVLKDQSSVGEITEITKDYTLKVSSLQEQMEGLQQSLIDKDKIITTNQSLMSDFEIDRKALQDRITSLTAEMVLKDQSSVGKLPK